MWEKKRREKERKKKDVNYYVRKRYYLETNVRTEKRAVQLPLLFLLSIETINTMGKN